MLFNYKVIDQTGSPKEGSIDAVTQDVAISSLQRRGFTITSISPVDKNTFLGRSLFEGVSTKDVVILSRQISTLFEAQVSALRIFRLLAAEAPNPVIRKHLTEVSDDLQGGTTISAAFSKHPKLFSDFYVNMVRAGEEAGKLDETFLFLADYLDRTYEVTSKARNALIYPAFVIVTFIVVMSLMLVLVIPRVSAILLESGQEIPLYTRIVVSFSTFLVNYGIFFVVLLIVGGFFFWRYAKTRRGRVSFGEFQISIPYIGELYRQLFLSRIADNLSTMLSSGIPMVRAVEITAGVVGNAVYEEALNNASAAIKAGSAVSDALGQHPEIPGIMVQMMKVGEETGQLGPILKVLAKFYRREVTNSVDTLVDLIEPILIVALGLGVGLLLASVLIPIYSISSAI